MDFRAENWLPICHHAVWCFQLLGAPRMDGVRRLQDVSQADALESFRSMSISMAVDQTSNGQAAIRRFQSGQRT
jgi:hypothetical protein